MPLLLLLAVSALGAGAKSKPVLTFSLTATNEYLVVRPERGFILSVWGPHEWDVDVSLAKNRDNCRGFLLYRTLNTHGPQPSDIMAWTHATRFYLDERVVRVRGYLRWVRIRLVDAQVSGGTNEWKFTGGRAEIYWQDHGPSRPAAQSRCQGAASHSSPLLGASSDGWGGVKKGSRRAFVRVAADVNSHQIRRETGMKVEPRYLVCNQMRERSTDPASGWR